MSFLAVVLLYPLLLSLLALGAGLLVERLAGVRLPLALVPATGFAALVVISQFTVLSGAIAPLTPWILALAAIAGFVLARGVLKDRWRARRRDWWLLPMVGAASYLISVMPLLAAGRLTFPGYLIDTTEGFHLAAGEWMLHHGVHLPPPTPAYGAMLATYYGHGYPSGGQVLLAATGWLSGQNLLWLYFPFQIVAVAYGALVLVFVGERAGLPRWAAAVAGVTAAASALVYSYALMGSIKELTALPSLLLMGALIPLAREQVRLRLRTALVFAVAAAGAIGGIGPAAAPWVGLFALAALACSLPSLRVSWRRLSLQAVPRSAAAFVFSGAALALLVVLLALPTVTRLAASLQTALNFSGSNTAAANDPGNLLQPLRLVQAFGIWLGPSHRADPQYTNATYVLIGIGVVCSILGIFWLFRRRAWGVLLFIGVSLVVWFVLRERGTEWTDAKVLMLTSPVVVLCVMIGAFGDLRVQRVSGVVVASVLVIGVLASDALLYHSTPLAPTEKFEELESIDQRFAGDGPTLLTDFSEYSLYMLRKLDVDAPGYAGVMRRPFVLLGGAAPAYGHSYDVDDIEAQYVQQFNLIVMRRSPRWSRPPGNFTLAWTGQYYDVWRRTGPPPAIHVPLGTSMQPVGPAPCGLVHSLSRQALADRGELRYASRTPNTIVSVATATHSPDVTAGGDEDGFPDLVFGGPGVIKSTFDLQRAGSYELWVGGDVDRRIVALIDGGVAGAAAAQPGEDGNMIALGSVHLVAGKHTIDLLRGGGSLAPGDDSAALIDGVYLVRGNVEQDTVGTIAPQAWRSLCGRELDWIEVT